MQQINLYHSSLRKQEQLVSFVNLSKSTIGLLVILSLLQSINVYQTASLKGKVKQTTLLLSEKKIQLEKFKSSLPKLEKDFTLQTKLSLLEEDLINKKNVLSILSNKKLGNTDGFTEHFKGLARQTIDNLWLTKLHFTQGGTILDIEGKSTTAELVPQYLQALSKEKIFNGTEFTSFIIQQTKNENALIFKFNNLLQTSNGNFELSSR